MKARDLSVTSVSVEVRVECDECGYGYPTWIDHNAHIRDADTGPMAAHYHATGHAGFRYVMPCTFIDPV